MKARMTGRGIIALNLDSRHWKTSSLLFAYSVVLSGQTDGQLQWLVSQIDNVGNRRNLTVNFGMMMMLVFEKCKNIQCRITMNEHVMKNVGDLSTWETYSAKTAI